MGKGITFFIIEYRVYNKFGIVRTGRTLILLIREEEEVFLAPYCPFDRKLQ